ncbi:SDR family oxidoreductase [uncultured Sunxiuqinia sp.]|jgi:NAD(P)-dependent dehydrogenase (short-subunit alcohol dehydrogenase family)|uniref:SDR family oxidoreductase n=1 Tax=uncultured Sunxiuqinia sp. TaxID=1573825 RepID=UPI0030D81413|tara:strand:- start:2675 stop:3535 length:861 start_codon:yes stop_codon:yes gene_type:complete
MNDYKKASEKTYQQTQPFPGDEYKMDPKPVYIRDNYKGTDKLKDKVALISGGDSGIGRAVAVHFAREGASIAIIYLSEDKDAMDTKNLVENEGLECLLFKGDIRDKSFCRNAVSETFQHYRQLNVLVNHAGEQHPAENLDEMDLEMMEKTYHTNIFAMYYLAKEALKHMGEGDCIINTSSVTGYYGSSHFLDYSGTNGAITAFTRALARNLADRKIRVNGVAPGPVWTPLIVSTFDDNEDFGKQALMKRPGQPCEIAPAYVYLASEDGSYTTGQMMHPNGGMRMYS